jgi:DNA polymerase elongation subunit (family B)
VVKKKKDGTAAASPPHVEVARVLKDRGRDVGEGAKIEYICIDGSTSPKKYQPAEDFDGTFDRHEVWETHVYPPTMRLLQAAFPTDGQLWARYEVTRPPKQRVSKVAKDNGTLDLFGGGK